MFDVGRSFFNPIIPSKTYLVTMKDDLNILIIDADPAIVAGLEKKHETPGVCALLHCHA